MVNVDRDILGSEALEASGVENVDEHGWEDDIRSMTRR